MRPSIILPNLLHPSFPYCFVFINFDGVTLEPALQVLLHGKYPSSTIQLATALPTSPFLISQHARMHTNKIQTFFSKYMKHLGVYCQFSKIKQYFWNIDNSKFNPCRDQISISIWQNVFVKECLQYSLPKNIFLENIYRQLQ